MSDPKSKDDLWEDFLQGDEDDLPSKTKKVVADGSEWTGKFDRRKKPRDEPKPDIDAANDPAMDDDQTSQGDQ